MFLLKLGFGTDEKRIIKEITALTNQQRQVVKEKYLAIFGHTLEEDLKNELKGEFEDIVVALLKPRFEYEAESIRTAIHVNIIRRFFFYSLFVADSSSLIY